MAIVRKTMILTGAHAGKTIILNHIQFVKGRATLEMDSSKIDGPITYFKRSYQVRIEGEDPEPESEAPAETTEAPAETTEAPAETTEAPAETTEATDDGALSVSEEVPDDNGSADVVGETTPGDEEDSDEESN